MIGLTPRERDLAAADAGHRAEFVQALINAAAFIATHLDIPVPATAEIPFYIPGPDDKAKRAMVDRIAATTGEGTLDDGRGHYSASRHFGPIAYVATFTSKPAMDACLAFSSYFGAVQPESQVAA